MTERAHTPSTLSVSQLLVVLLLWGMAWLVYWPGLSGPFLFDDHSNLSLLGQFGEIDNWQSFWLYLLSGFSGASGRPVSYLSFLVDANNWPADPWPFKRTNLVIHLLNGLLLLGLGRAILLSLGYSARQAFWMACLAAALWLLHPFWVSTTLYVVQRMAQLSAFFTLVGLWVWVAWRRQHVPRADWQTWAVALFSVGGCGLLAVLSKENGALLPAFVLVLEATILATLDARRGTTPTRGFRRLRWIVLGVPLSLLVVYLSRELPALFSGDMGGRAFTSFERLLTEGRILWDYIAHLVFPRPYTGGLFNDGIDVSRGWLTPWTTIVAWLALGALAFLAVRMRRRWPLLAAAILFFLVGHVLESSFLQLELYFEHRNYLPAMLLGLPLAAWWVGWKRVPSDVRLAIPVGVLLLLAAMTFLRADIWSSPYLQALKWAQVNPESPRAQHHLAGFWWEIGNVEEARRLNDRAISLDPDGLPWLMTRVMYQCSLDERPAEALAEVESALNEKGRMGPVGTYQTGKLLDYLMSGGCGRLSRPSEILMLIARLERAADGSGRLQALLLQRRAALLLREGEGRPAYRNLRELVQTTGRPGTQLRAAAMLASASHYEWALELLDEDIVTLGEASGFSMQRLRAWYLDQTGYYDRERRSLKEAIRQDFNEQAERGEREILPALP
ncbi:hypothetical protein AUR63_10255 [Guyparkeria sp. XI15]|nr:hypothetical protein AUR63_10255 [Guyparkeria sp. XI15]OAE86696.1 hypothetical protein AWR35_10270 [Guyparkeria sp. WRN-7]